MRFRVTEEIAAAPEQVWAVLADVEHWPDWTPTMTSVRRLDAGPLGPTSAAEIRQPKLPKTVWRVTRFEPGRRFEWAAGGPGVTTRGDHVVEPLDDGRSSVTLEIATVGALAGVVALLLGSLTRRYVSLEASSLKRRCETAHPTR
jgi:uncharacterized membrane protein